MSRLAADPQSPPPRARAARLHRSLQHAEATSCAEAPAAGTGEARTTAARQRDPSPRPTRWPHPRVLPSRRMRGDTNNGALHGPTQAGPPFASLAVWAAARADGLHSTVVPDRLGSDRDRALGWPTPLQPDSDPAP